MSYESDRIAAENGAEFAFFISSFVMSVACTATFAYINLSERFDELESATVSVFLFLGAGGLFMVVLGAVFNSLVAGLAVRIAELLARLSAHKHVSWARADRLAAAAFWPLVLVFWLVVSPVRASVNHAFLEEGPTAD